MYLRVGILVGIPPGLYLRVYPGGYTSWFIPQGGVSLPRVYLRVVYLSLGCTSGVNLSGNTRVYTSGLTSQGIPVLYLPDYSRFTVG